MSRFTVIDCDQRTPEWFAARAGRVTASRAGDMLARIKSGEAASRRNYRTQLVAERLTGRPQENGYVSPAMQQGIDLEPVAIAAYEAYTGSLVKRCGFLALTDMAAGCSIDGYVGDLNDPNNLTLVSVKCPQATAHLDYLWERRVPPRYVPQTTHELWVSGAQTYHFVSYNESFPEKLQLLVVSADRSEFEITPHGLEVRDFIKEIDQEVARMAKWSPPWSP